MIKLIPFIIFFLLPNLAAASDCKTTELTMLILDVIDITSPEPKAINDMNDRDIPEVFESRIRNKLYVWIPKEADVQVVAKVKTISQVKFGFAVEGHVAFKYLNCKK